MDKQLIFSTSMELIRIPVGTVVCITADGNYSSISMADGENFVLTMQLGQIERRIAESLNEEDHRFIRIGKSLIVNREFIAFINPSRQRLILSDCKTFRRELSASKDALKALKELIEGGAL